MNWRWRQVGKAGALSGSVLLVVSLASSKVLLDGFERAEDDSVRQVARGGGLAFAQRVSGLSEKFAEWSSWDNMCRFVAAPPLGATPRQRRQQREEKAYRAAFLQSNLMPESLSLLRVSMIAIVGIDGRLVWGTGFDRASGRMTPLPPEMAGRLRPGSELLRPRGTGLVQGLIKLDSGLAMVTSRPIIKSDRTGPTRGFLIAGRALDSDEWSRLRTATGLNLSMLPLKPRSFAPGLQLAHSPIEAQIVRELEADASRASRSTGRSIGARSKADSRAEIRVAALSEDEVAAFSPLRDIDGRLLGALRMVQPRTLMQQGLGTLSLFHWVFWSLGLGSLSLSLFLLRRSETRFRALVHNGWDIVAILRPHPDSLTSSASSASARPRSRKQAQVLGEHVGQNLGQLQSPQVVYISPAVGRTLGYGPRQVENTGVSLWLHPDDRERALEQISLWMQAHEGTRLGAISCRWRHAEGSWRDLEMTGVHWPHDPDIQGLVLNARDVSEQKRAQERALAEAGRFSSLLRSTPEGILIADSHSRIVASNPAAQKLFGYAEQDLALLSLSQLMPDRFAGAAGALAPNGVADGEGVADGSVPVEVRARRSDGSEFLGELSLARWRSKNEAGQDEEFTAGLLRDISERKQAQARLTHSTRQLQASLAEKEVLLKEIHHRVKNNMQVISSILSLQASTLDDPAVRTALRESQGRIKSMALIHEKLYRSDDLARVDFGDYLRGLTQDLVRSHPPRGSRRSARLELELETVRLNIDQAAPCGLLVNELLSNALKHAFTGCDPSIAPLLRVRLSHHPSHNGEQEVTVEVLDNGRGIEAGFDWRASESLGLQLVTTLTEQLEGHIECLPNAEPSKAEPKAEPAEAAEPESSGQVLAPVLAAGGTLWRLRFEARGAEMKEAVGTELS